MRVSELMQRPVKTVNLDAAVNDAIVTLADSHISALPVVDAVGRMVGVISSTDILTSEAEAEDADARQDLFEETMVGDIMTRHALTVSPDAEVREAAQQMLYADIHRLFVVEGERVVGVISTTDVMRAVATGRL
ncbi:MAG TPA: CBS domain-containing protein [Gemmatimonadales bacterium]|nr:CBS domain-containing protein [Gemmatimonadales bacterium]